MGTTPERTISIRFEGLPPRLPRDSIVLTTSIPSETSPKTTCRPSSWIGYHSVASRKSQGKPTHAVSTVVMKNWEPFECGPALAIDRRPGFECLRRKFSSRNGRVRIRKWMKPQSQAERTTELFPIDRPSSCPIMRGKVSALDHELEA